jgi:hypothetical protein
LLRGIDIAHWHRLTIDPETKCPRLSSRRLLVLLDKLPDESEYKTMAERGGRLPPAIAIAAQSFNEQLRLRASFHAANSTDDNDARFDPEPYFYLDPVDLRAQAEQEQREAEQAALTEPELAEAGWI